MADLIESLALADHPGPGCMHDRERRISGVYDKWLTTPEAVAAFELLAKMMDCACADVKTVEEYDALVASAKDAEKEPAKEGEAKVAAPVAFTTAEAQKYVTAIRAAEAVWEAELR